MPSGAKPNGQHPAELALKRAWDRGQPLDLRSGDPVSGDPIPAEDSGPDRAIRAEFLRDLLTADERRRKLCLFGARITGPLDLEAVTIAGPLELRECHFDERLVLRGADLLSLRLTGCTLAAGIDAAGLRTRGNLFLTKVSAERDVVLTGARIDGQLELSGGRFECEDRAAVQLDGVTIGADMFCAGMESRGAVSIIGARIMGQLILSGADLHGEGAVSLAADGLIVEQDLWLDESFAAAGQVRFVGAQVNGELNVQEARVESAPYAIDASGITVGQSLTVGPEAAISGGLDLTGATVHGTVNFSRLDIDNPDGPAVRTDRAKIDHDVRFTDVRARGGMAFNATKIGGSLICSGADIEGLGATAISAHALDVGRDCLFRSGTHIKGESLLIGAKIGGALDCSGVTMVNPGGAALNADRIVVGEVVALTDDYAAYGQTRLPGGHIGGQVLLGGTFDVTAGSAIVAHSIRIDQDCLALDSCEVSGTVSMAGAHIDGVLAFHGQFRNPGAVAIHADRVVIGERALFGPEFTAEGELRLIGARIGADLDFAGTVRAPGGAALSADKITIEGGVYWREGAQVVGETRIPGARVSGQVVLTGAILRNPAGVALECGRLDVREDMHCDRVVAFGEVSLAGARIGGSLSLRASVIRNAGGTALNLSRAVVEEDALFDYMEADGRVDCYRMRAGSVASFDGATISAYGTLALDLEGAGVGKRLELSPGRPMDGWVDLRDAEIETLADSSAAWVGGYELGGCRYAALSGRGDARLEWLRGNRSGYMPQLYDTLADVSQRAGEDAQRRTVLIEKQRRRKAHLPLIGRIWSGVQDLLIGYGYQTWRALIPFAAILAAGTAYFAAAHHHGHIVARTTAASAHPPAFRAFIYSLDLLVPVINLGQRESWVAVGRAQLWATLIVLSGWVLTTAIIAALTGMVRRTT